MNRKYSGALTVIVSALAMAGTALAGADCDKAAGKAGHGAHNRMTELDTNKDGKVNLAELTQSKQSWLAQVDTNKDGAATLAEVEAHTKAEHEKRVQQLFQNKDANRDGRLSREESGMPERWFERNDENKDGSLSPAELAARGAKGGKRADAGKKHGGKLRHMDQNADGKIDRTEVTQAASTMLQRLDRNADGALSADELGSRGKGRHHGKGEGRHAPDQNDKPQGPTRS